MLNCSPENQRKIVNYLKVLHHNRNKKSEFWQRTLFMYKVNIVDGINHTTPTSQWCKTPTRHTSTNQTTKVSVYKIAARFYHNVGIIFTWLWNLYPPEVDPCGPPVGSQFDLSLFYISPRKSFSNFNLLAVSSYF